jgi:hypothetical protein
METRVPTPYRKSIRRRGLGALSVSGADARQNRGCRTKITGALPGQANWVTHSKAGRVRTAPPNKRDYLPTPFGVGWRLLIVSDRGAFLRSHRVSGVELPVALFDAARPLVPGNGGTDMVRASAFACCGDFRLRSAGCK